MKSTQWIMRNVYTDVLVCSKMVSYPSELQCCDITFSTFQPWLQVINNNIIMSRQPDWHSSHYEQIPISVGDIRRHNQGSLPDGHSQAFYLVMFKIRMGFTVLIDTSTAEEVVQTGAASRSDM